jgi:hypothetical protein
MLRINFWHSFYGIKQKEKRLKNTLRRPQIVKKQDKEFFEIKKCNLKQNKKPVKSSLIQLEI